MHNTVLQKTIDLRAEVWREICNSSAFQSFKALDSAVSAMGGKSILADVPSERLDSLAHNTGANQDPNTAQRRRVSQGDVAEAVLTETGKPLPIKAMLEAMIARGVNVKGDDPLPNIRSTLSRDKRFKSVMRNGGYYWWLVGKSEPLNWNETAGPDLLAEPAASSASSNQKGGESLAATIASS